MLFYFLLPAQKLRPGFDKGEYTELLKLTARHMDTAYSKKLPLPQVYKLVYRSPVVGLDNRWDLWYNGDGIAAISIRGSTSASISWTENFYTAMAPAKGSLQLSKTNTFDYTLAQASNAAVHTGWLTGMAFLAQDIVPKIDSCYNKGIKDILLVGHSQGGAISYLLTSYLYQLQAAGKLAKDIRFKTYCSAAPKPGNLYYAYAYEQATAGGWAYNVVNTADWVPETPSSVQTLNDFTTGNPFSQTRTFLSRQKFPRNLILKHIFNRLNKPAVKTQRRYERYLGHYTAKIVKKHLAGYKPPVFYNSSNYVRTGNTIILFADEAYHKTYPDNKKNAFTHHGFAPYLYLAQKLP